MRTVLICAGVVVISGVVSATMWSELRTARKLTADLQTQLTDANGRIQTLTLAAQRNNFQPAPAPAPAAAPTATVSDTKVASPAPVNAATSAVFSASLQESRAREKEMMADPEYRKARLAQQRMMSTERNYPGLAEELGLSQKEADQLLDLLTENQMNRSSEMSLVLGGGGTPDRAAMAELQQRQRTMEREEEQQVATLLGAGKYGKWQEYKQSQSGRVQAVQLGTQLAQVGQPLSAVQQRGLTTVMIAEQKRMQSRIEPLVRNASQLDPQARLQLQEQAMQWEAESNANMLTAAAAHLTERQIATLRQQFESQAAMSSAQRRLNQSRQESQGFRPAP